MSALLRKLAIYICIPIYRLIKYIYYIFYNLANTRFLNSEIISQFSSNIYVLVSVVMLFAFSVVILSAIVNPDLLGDNKKGVTALFKRSILALVMMVAVPLLFDILYAVQANIMDNSLIEKIIVGTGISCQVENGTEGDPETEKLEEKCKSGGNGGQVIAGTLISSVVVPVDDDTIKVDEDVQESYNAMIAEDIKHIGNFAEHINTTTDNKNAGWIAGADTKYAFDFNGLLAIVCGLGCVYILVIYSMDVAVRVFKLAFMELTAPISIVGYIAAGDKILSSWFQELVKTYMDLFIRIACIAFYLFLISNLSSFLKPFQGEDWSFVLKAFLVVGMLIFVKQLPDLINKVFGTDIKLKGGIGGRLGEMAAVGKQAQKAWGAVKKVGEVGAGAGLLGAAAVSHWPVALGAGLVGGFGAYGWNKGFRGKGAWKDRTPGRLTKTAGAFFRSTNGIAGTKDAIKTWNENANPTRQYEKEQNKITKLKDKAKAEAQAIANSVTNGLKGANLYDANGDIDKQIAQGVKSKSIMDKSSFKNNQKNTANSYMEKKFKLLQAENAQNSYNSVGEILNNAMKAASSNDEKQKILEMQTNFDSGQINTKQLMSNLSNSGISSFVTDSGGLTDTAQRLIQYSVDFADNGMTKSKQTIADEINDANIAFSTAESAYNDMLDKMGENDKIRMKAYVKVGNEVNKANVK